MKKIFITIFLAFVSFNIHARSISNIESRGGWYYIYDENGKKAHTLSASIGTLVGYSSQIFIVSKGSWYYIYDADGKKIHTMSASSVGDILSVTADTFTSQKGSWIYTWSSTGKKISTRSAR